MSGIKIEIDYDTADQITVKTLKSAYKRMTVDLQILEAKEKSEGLEKFEKQDLKDIRKYKKALKRSLRYFMIMDEYDRFIGENE